jgi:hypothetical protein
MDQGWIFLALWAIFSFLCLILAQVIMRKRGLLTANRFALLQIAGVETLIIVGFLGFPISYLTIIIFAALSLLCWIGGYPFFRLIYRRWFAHS